MHTAHCVSGFGKEFVMYSTNSSLLILLDFFCSFPPKHTLFKYLMQQPGGCNEKIRGLVKVMGSAHILAISESDGNLFYK